MENRDFSETPGANDKPRAKATFPADQLTVNDWVGSPLIGRVPYDEIEPYSSLRNNDKENEGKQGTIVEEEEGEHPFNIDEIMAHYFETRAQYKGAKPYSDEWADLRKELDGFDLSSERYSPIFDTRVRCDIPYLFDVERFCNLVTLDRMQKAFRKIGGLANGSMRFGWSISSEHLTRLLYVVYVYTGLDDGEDTFEMVEFRAEDKESYDEFKRIFEVIATCVTDIDKAAAEKAVEANEDEIVLKSVKNQLLVKIIREGWK